MFLRVAVPFQICINLPNLLVLILPRVAGWVGGWVAGKLRLYSLAQPSYAGAFAEFGKSPLNCQNSNLREAVKKIQRGGGPPFLGGVQIP